MLGRRITHALAGVAGAGLLATAIAARYMGASPSVIPPRPSAPQAVCELLVRSKVLPVEILLGGRSYGALHGGRAETTIDLPPGKHTLVVKHGDRSHTREVWLTAGKPPELVVIQPGDLTVESTNAPAVEEGIDGIPPAWLVVAACGMTAGAATFLGRFLLVRTRRKQDPGAASPRGPTPMNGDHLREIRDALRSAFTLDTLDQMLMFRLGITRADIVADGPMETVLFRLLERVRMEGREAELIEAAYRERPRNPGVRAVYLKHGLAPGRFPDAGELERIVRASNAMLDLGEWCARAAEIEGRVCRVELNGGARGTGFLVGPDVLLTNFHVMEPVIKGEVSPAAVTARFDYKQLTDGTVLPGAVFRLAADDWRLDDSPYSALDLGSAPDDTARDTAELDYALVRLEGAPGNQPVDRRGGGQGPPRGWVAVPAAASPLLPGHPLFIVQHPQGLPLKLALDTEAVIAVNANGTRVRYRTNTDPGSSGSPCFNQHWELVALHHVGDPAFVAGFNQGIPVGTIRALLTSRGKEHLLAPEPARLTPAP